METAYNAYEADDSAANCQAVITAPEAFDAVGEGLDENCAEEYNESELENLIGMAFSVGFGTPTSCGQ
ncbi:MAG: hypothetical protein JXR07_07150 [Reichenbachiella sp.]